MFKEFSLRIGSRLLIADHPLVMGIVNCTPDSFFEGSRLGTSETSICHTINRMAEEEADIIDIGGCSTRPGSKPVDAETEWARISGVLKEARRMAPNLLISVDTFRSEIARRAVAEGADIINDISGGDDDKDMASTVASLGTPFIIMHKKGVPENMQTLAEYPEGVVIEVVKNLSEKIRKLHLQGIADIIADPGFGFAKTIAHNYELLANLPAIREALDVPLLVGMSRKSMITRLLDISPEEALPATMALNVQALIGGASIIRVHDVKEGRQAVRLAEAIGGLTQE